EPSNEVPSDDKPSDEEPSNEVPSDDKPSDEEPSDETSGSMENPDSMPSSLEDMNVGQLQKLARANGLEPPKNAKKQELISALRGE
ncbi:Rho termination factor N-terminal domain-containing protein, partial [Phascolarctobacterium succinatutens]|uniref:Rho termination factor N-terminal domain-containing protein n=1 Tax=Phascolarctobacterium succinatutens TaxID=626940 RepID=UPI0026F0620B